MEIIKPVLRGVAALGLLGSVIAGNPGIITYAHEDGDTQQPETPPLTKEQLRKLREQTSGPSTSPHLELVLSCSPPHMYDENLRWKQNHLDIKASFDALDEKSLFLAIDDGEKMVLLLWMISREAGGALLSERIIFTNHGFVQGYVPGVHNPDGTPVYGEVWLKPGKIIKVALYASDPQNPEVWDWTKPLGEQVAQVEASKDCPDASSDRSGLVEIN